MSKRLLNLGCGRRFHADWENVDFVALAPAIKAHDLRQGIPYGDESFDVVYHSHLLEHFPKKTAPLFLRECRRVLKREGVIRIAVPDLEKIARAYLEAFEKASQGVPTWKEKYDWMMLELYDQAVRERSGGACFDYLRSDPVPNWDYILERAGAEAVAARDAARAEHGIQVAQRAGFGDKWGYVFRNLGQVLRNKLKLAVLSDYEREALELGKFRRQGEIHQWMYDSYSLARLLIEVDFSSPQRCEPTESQIPNWATYCLDSEIDGAIYKPDSMYMEAVKS
jgi:SAM-dependent methyltransferase